MKRGDSTIAWQGGLSACRFQEPMRSPSHSTGSIRRVQARMALKAAHTLHPDWTFCLFSAAVAHGLQVPQELLFRTHVAISPSESRRKHPGQVACHIDKGGGHVIGDNIPCTTLMQTTLDCLCASTFRQGLAIVDSVLHHRLATKERLVEYFAAHGKGRRGIRQAREHSNTPMGAAKTAGNLLSGQSS